MQLANFVQEVASMFEPEAQAKGLAFHYEELGTLPAVVRADEKRVRQILINLLGNAIKFTTAGQVTFRIRYAREMATIEIEDTGPGLTAQELERIFEPFNRAHTSGTTAPGSGLGLTIAKMLADLMGGELTVTSTPGVGSVFKVKLFLSEVRLAGLHPGSPAAKLFKATKPKPRHGYAGLRRRVLVVDNEEADRELLVNLLQPLGFELRTAASGHDCLDLITTGYQPDVIFMDLAMPGIDGWETIRRLRALARNGPVARAHIAIVSANAFDKGLENDVGIPGEDFHLKPVRHSELLDWLERRLELDWLETVVTLPASTGLTPGLLTPAPFIFPEQATLDALREVVALGYYRGILNQLDQIDASDPKYGQFVSTLREMAQKFQFEAMSQTLTPTTHEN